MHTATDESKRVTAWNIDKLRSLGLTKAQARALDRSSVSWHDVSDLMARGCDPALAFRILKGL